MSDLTLRQLNFCDEYLVDLNATQAAIRAGYAPDSAGSAAHLLKNPAIAAHIKNAQEQRAARLEITADRVTQEIAKIAFASMDDFLTLDTHGEPILDLSKAGRVNRAAISEVVIETVKGGGKRTRFRLHNKLDALTQLGRHLGLFTDKTVNVNLDAAQMSDEQLSDELARLRAATDCAQNESAHGLV